MSSRLIVFDLDGTIVDTIDSLLYSAWLTLQEYEFNIPGKYENWLPAFPRYIAGQGGMAILQFLIEVSSKRLNSSYNIKEMYNSFLKHYSNNITFKAFIFPFLRDVLSDLFTSGWTLAVNTNKKQDNAVSLLQEIGLMKYFTIIVGASDNDINKPAPDGVNYIMKYTGSTPSDTVFIGDSEIDLLTARNANVRCVLVDFGYEKHDIRKLAPDAHISSYSMLQKALTDLYQTN